MPELSDRLLSERMKELESRGVVARHVDPGPPVKVMYELTDMGRALEPALQELKSWARRWLRGVEKERALGALAVAPRPTTLLHALHRRRILQPHRAIASSRILNFCTFPVTVIGKPSVNTT